MKKLYCFTIFLAINFVFAQVSVNTANPQGSFHVDGAKDNPVTGIPTATQQANDFVVTSNGSIGIGTTIPADKFEIAGGDLNISNYTEKTPAAGDQQRAGGLSFRLGNGAQRGLPVAGIVGYDRWDGTSITTSTPAGIIVDEIDYKGDLAIQTLRNSVLTEAMRVTSGGSVGIGTSAPGTKSILDLSATDKGFLLPRLTTAQRTAIAPNATTDKGMQVYDTNTDSIWYWNGTSWLRHRNLYDSNGDISPASAVSRTISFTNGGSLNIDNSTVVVDATNNRLGVGTGAPVDKVDISGGDLSISNPVFKTLGEDDQKAGELNFRVGGNALERFVPTASIIGYDKYTGGDYAGDLAVKTQFGPNLIERMRITSKGNVGIGTATPADKVEIMGGDLNISNDAWKTGGDDDQKAGEINFRLGGNSDQRASPVASIVGYDKWTTGSHAYYGDLVIKTLSSGLTEKMRVTAVGNVGIGTSSPTQKLHVMGNILASAYNTPSDIRIKKDITDNAYGLKELLELRTIRYHYKDKALGKDHKLGFVAQQIKTAMPELVTTADDEIKTLGVNYAEMTVVLTKAVQQQQEMLSRQEEMLKSQQEQITALKSQVKKLLEDASFQ